MAYQADIISKRLISGIDELIVEFSENSPIPRHVYYELVDESKVYLKKALFDPQLLEEIGTPENYTPNRIGYSGQKKQTVFIVKSGQKNFTHPFINLTVGGILKKLCPNKKFCDIEKIVIITKYTWRLNPAGGIFDQDRSILVFDLLPEHKQALEKELQNF